VFSDIQYPSSIYKNKKFIPEFLREALLRIHFLSQ
jgi:hypothetical protein